MSSRWAALVIAGVAAVLCLAVARPLRAQAAAYADAFGAARVERRAIRATSALQRRSQDGAGGGGGEGAATIPR